MAQKDLTPFTKGSKKASECGKKGKRGISIVRAIKEQFESGNVDLKLVSKGMCLMMIKNPAMARLIMEYVDGKVPDKSDVNLTGVICNIDKEEYKRVRKEMLEKDDC